MVYQYVSKGAHPLPDQFWYLKSFESDNEYFIQGNIYDQFGQLQQFYKEKINQTGITTEEFNLVTFDSLSGKSIVSPVDINYDDVYPFMADLGGIFLYSLSWKYNNDTITSYQLIRNRIFRGDTTIVFNQEKYPAILFTVKDRVEQEQDGTIGINTFGKEIYAKGIGLVGFEKKFETGESTIYNLKKIYSIDEFKKEFGLNFDMEDH